VPGGRVEADELLESAVVREVAEETGLDVVVDELLGWVERFHGDAHYVILDFRVTVLDPERVLEAGDDAAEAAWIPLADLAEHTVVEGLLDFLRDNAVLD
jgi:8-oxo-dGTP diphosphatase